MFEQGKCYLFRHEKRYYEGFVVQPEIQVSGRIKAPQIYARILNNDFICPFTLRHFYTTHCHEVEQIENLHFFSIDELVELFMSLKGPIKFLGFTHSTEALVWKKVDMYINRISGQDELYFECNRRFIEVDVHYNTADGIRTDDFHYYYIKTLSKEEMAEKHIVKPVNKIVEIEKVNRLDLTGIPTGIVFGKYAIYDFVNGAVKDPEYQSRNGFRVGDY